MQFPPLGAVLLVFASPIVEFDGAGIRNMIKLIVAGLGIWLGLAFAASAGILWGVNGHPLTAYPGIGIGRQLDQVADLGMKSYRVNISTADEADGLEALVEAGRARGVTILPVVTPGGIDLDRDASEALYRTAFKLAVTLGSRFKNDIRVWELGNEMENYAIIRPCEKRDDGSQYPCDWGPAGGVDPLDYYGPRWRKVSAVLKGLSDGMRSVDPGIRLAIGSAGWGHVGVFERLRRDGVGWDISVWHMYGQDPEWAFERLAAYGHPIWVTEFDYPYGSQNSGTDQAAGLQRWMTRLEELSRKYTVEAAYVYELFDEPYWAPSFEAVMGLVRLEREGDRWFIGRPKPAYEAVKEKIRSAGPRRECELAAEAASGPPVEGRIRSAYCLVFGRSPTVEETRGWFAAFLNTGSDMGALLAAMLRSDAFETISKTRALSDRDYVRLIFRLLLDREPDGHGLETYVADLSRGALTRETIAARLASSKEFRERHPILAAASAAPDRGCSLDETARITVMPARRAAYVHCLVFGENADASFVARWSPALDAGGASELTGLILKLLESEKFADLYPVADLTDRGYLQLLYQLLLNRKADEVGLQSFLAEISAGAATRESVARSLVGSDEFKGAHGALFDTEARSAPQP